MRSWLRRWWRRPLTGWRRWTSTGRSLLVNRQVEMVFGYSREDLVGQPVEVLLRDALGIGLIRPGLGLSAALSCQGGVFGWLGLSTLARAGAFGQGGRQPASFTIGSLGERRAGKAM